MATDSVLKPKAAACGAAVAAAFATLIAAHGLARAEPAANYLAKNAAAPFPVSAAARGQKETFSYAPESGFIRISFAAAPGGKSAAAPQLYGLITLDLKPGRKTYWRNPGTSGFAPKIELESGAKAEILFPAPQLLREEGEWAYGYSGHVALPFRITLPPHGRRALYAGSVTLGICDTVCAPQKLAFQFSPARPGNAQAEADIAAALAALPKAADKNFRLLSAKPIKSGLRLALRLPEQNADAQLFLDGGGLQLGLPQRQSGAAEKEAGHKTAQAAMLRIYDAPLLFGAAKNGQEITYTAVLGNGRAVTGKVPISQ